MVNPTNAYTNTYSNPYDRTTDDRGGFQGGLKGWVALGTEKEEVGILGPSQIDKSTLVTDPGRV